MRVDDLGCELVREVAGRARSGVVADAVHREAIRDDRVVDLRLHARVRLERREQRVVGADPRRSILARTSASSSEIVWSRPSNGICSVDVTWSNSVCQAPCATGSRSASMRSSSSLRMCGRKRRDEVRK